MALQDTANKRHDSMGVMREIWVISIGVGLLLAGCTHTFDGVSDNTPVGDFESLWKIIDEKYCYLEEKNVDWDSVYAVYHPRFESMTAVERGYDYACFDLLAEVLNLLEDGHVNLYSVFDVSVCKSWYAGYPANYDSKIVSKYYLKDYRHAGGLYYQLLDSGHVGYVYYGSFSNSFSEANMVAVLHYFQACDGLVIDVRNNGGGDMTNAYKLASPFFTSDTVVGYWQHKSGPGRGDFSELESMCIEDVRGYWRRPVVVLCNRNSYSAANFFVSIMRYANNCRIIGGKSGGGGGMPLSYELPNGWLVRFSSVKMFDRDYRSIEGGIEPDDEVTLLSEDKDDIIEAAIEWIHKSAR